MLSESEIAVNYLILTIGSMSCLFDFGFSAQFTRNFAYVFNGAKKLQKEGVVEISIEEANKGLVDYHLLAVVLFTAKKIYRIISALFFLFLITVGSYYIYEITDGFTLVKNVKYIWLLYSASVFFNMYYGYMAAALTSKGLIKEYKQAVFYSRISYLLIAYVMLICGCGLISVVVANFATFLVLRLLCVKYFYSADIKSALKKQHVSSNEIKEMFKVIWYNSKKMGIVSLSSLVVSKAGIFFAGIYLSIQDVASYGLMSQLIAVLSSTSIAMLSIYQPRFASFRIAKEQKKSLLKDICLSMGVFYTIFICGAITFIFFGPFILEIIKANAELPSRYIFILFCLISFLEMQHTNFSTIITSSNSVPFVKASVFSAIFIVLGTFVSLKYFHFGLLGLILIPGIVQLCYQDWKWAKVVCNDFNVSYLKFVIRSFQETYLYVKDFAKALKKKILVNKKLNV